MSTTVPGNGRMPEIYLTCNVDLTRRMHSSLWNEFQVSPGVEEDVWYVLAILLGVLVVLIAIHVYLYRWLARGTRMCRSWADLTGKTALVTGANSGIGYQVAMDLAWRHARVILACRDRKKADDAVRTIRTATGNNDVLYYQVELSSLASVRQFVQHFKMKEDRLDILVNNAATLGSRSATTSEGLEVTFATNHLGPFLLTTQLLDVLRASAPSRIVNVSSEGHRMGAMDFRHPRGKPAAWNNSVLQMYNNTKLANVLFTRELSRRLAYTGVTANSVHPGMALTHIYRNLYWPIRWYFYKIGKYILKDAEQAAQTPIYLAVSEEIEGITGRYFDNMCIVQEAKHAKDDRLAKKLWELSEEYTRL